LNATQFFSDFKLPMIDLTGVVSFNFLASQLIVNLIGSFLNETFTFSFQKVF